MAIFGAPVAHEDDAVQACNAALALHEAFDAFQSAR
jgi:class 3 adenylate cyclase